MELRWTRRLQRALREVRDLERTYVAGRDRSMPLDMAKVELAEALLEAIVVDDRVNRFPARFKPARAALREQGARRIKKA